MTTMLPKIRQKPLNRLQPAIVIFSIAVATILFFTIAADAAQAWYTPYQPDEDTVALFHFDKDQKQWQSAGDTRIKAKLRRGASLSDGIFGRGVSLQGAKQDIRIHGSEALVFDNDQPFTVECWIKPHCAAGAVFSIGVRFYLQAHFNRGTARVGYRAASFPIRWFPLNGIPWRRNQWQHVAVTHTSSRKMSLYIDGKLAATTTHKDEGDWERHSNASFGSHDGWSKFMRGSIDEVRISKTVRNFQPILQHTNYRRDERVSLNITSHQLPRHIASIAVTATHRSGAEVFSDTLSRENIADPLFPASKLGDRPVQLTIQFRTAADAIISQLQRSIHFVASRIDSLHDRIAAVRDTAGKFRCEEKLPELSIAENHLKAAERQIQRRALDIASGHVAAAEHRVTALRTTEAQYRQKLRRTVRSAARRHDDIRITLSWTADSDPAAAITWAKRLGANEIVTGHNNAAKQGLKLWHQNGYHTVMLSGTPIHAAERDAPDQHQFGYWCVDTPPAENNTARTKPQSTHWAGMGPTTIFDPAEYWLVEDIQTKKKLPPDRWTYNKDTKKVTIHNAVNGHRYRVYYLMRADRSKGDPLSKSFVEHGLQKLRDEVRPLRGVLDTYWYDDLSYAWPGRTPQGGYDWESYTFAARPENQQRFTEETGIEFDPRWLVMPPKTLNVVPKRQYFAWMHWVQEHVKDWMKRAAAVPENLRMNTWLYWGDCHVGMEPYLGSVTAGNIDQIDRPARDPVTARALIDFGGNIYRRTRLRWLHSHIAGELSSPRDYQRHWDRARRGFLLAPPEGLYWMPFENVAKQSNEALREDLVQRLAQINDEFRLIGKHLAGQRAYEGALNLYVAHAWGRQYSWRPWRDPVLWHLTDLPVRVRFISFRKIIKAGVPTDAHALFLYGMPGTAWSGGYFWQNAQLRKAVAQFVAHGGGVVGVQAPSHTEKPQPHPALADVFGVTGKGTETYSPADITDDALDEDAAAAASEAHGRALIHCRDAALDGIPPLTDHIPELRDTVTVGKLADDADLLYALDRENGMAAGVVTHRFGDGRAAYLCGHSRHYQYSILMRRLIFWAADRADRLSDLNITGAEGLFVYAYPDSNILAVLNTADEPADAVVRCKPEVLGEPPQATFAIRDLATGRQTAENARIADGFRVHAVPHCSRLLKLTGG